MNRRILDKKFGDKGEEYAIDILERYFEINLTKTPDNHVMDFFSDDNTYFEVKSRNNTYNKYDTTMIGYNKVQYANKLNRAVYFVFNFTDGIYYYKYDISKLNELEIKIGGRCDRGSYEYKKYAYISIDKLIKIEFPKNDSILKVYDKGVLVQDIKTVEDLLYSV